MNKKANGLFGDEKSEKVHEDYISLTAKFLMIQIAGKTYVAEGCDN